LLRSDSTARRLRVQHWQRRSKLGASYALDAEHVSHFPLGVVVAGLTLHSVVVHLSAFHATLPRINSLISDFSSGQIDLRVADRDIELMETSRSGNSKDRSKIFKSSQFTSSQTKNSHARTSQLGSSRVKAKAGSQIRWPGERTSSEELRTECSSKRKGDVNSRDYAGDADETGSQSSLSRNAVYQTVEFKWEEEYGTGKP
jgi:hypothetical protein